MGVFLSSQRNLGGCEKEIAMVQTTIERALIFNSTADKAAIYEMFNNTNMDIDRRDFMFFIADIFAVGVEYGMREYTCKVLESDFYKENAIDLVAFLARDGFNIGVENYDADKLSNTTLDVNKHHRQYLWQ